jgi:hypothetical protein
MQALAARANGVTWLTGDMRNFELQQRFDRILLPNNVLFCLLSVEDVKACLRQVVKHLAPGGRVVLDVYRADPDPDTEADDVDEAEPVAELELGGVVYDVFEKSAWDSEPQRLQVTYVHAPRGGGELVSYDIPQRYLTEHELDSLLAEAGLRVLERWGGFQGEAPDEDAETLVRIAELG